MARTLEEIRASRPKIDLAKINATTEADIRRHAIEDGQDPNAPLTGFVKRRPGERGAGLKTPKVQIAIRLDRAALEAWRASGPGWQSRINDLVVRGAPGAKRRA